MKMTLVVDATAVAAIGLCPELVMAACKQALKGLI